MSLRPPRWFVALAQVRTGPGSGRSGRSPPDPPMPHTQAGWDACYGFLPGNRNDLACTGSRVLHGLCLRSSPWCRLDLAVVAKCPGRRRGRARQQAEAAVNGGRSHRHRQPVGPEPGTERSLERPGRQARRVHAQAWHRDWRVPCASQRPELPEPGRLVICAGAHLLRASSLRSSWSSHSLAGRRTQAVQSTQRGAQQVIARAPLSAPGSVCSWSTSQGPRFLGVSAQSCLPSPGRSFASDCNW